MYRALLGTFAILVQSGSPYILELNVQDIRTRYSRGMGSVRVSKVWTHEVQGSPGGRLTIALPVEYDTTGTRFEKKQNITKKTYEDRKKHMGTCAHVVTLSESSQ